MEKGLKPMSSKPITLKSLLLKNFATFSDTTIDFSTHFNTIIGETGSGKSLILDALQLILGGRVDKKFIRKNEDFTIIEALFIINDQQDLLFFQELGYPCQDNELIIKRIINRKGSSKAYINFQQCPISHLQLFARNFIDLVGQFENQKLLESNYQLKLIDTFSKNQTLLTKYQKAFSNWQKLQEQLHELKQKKIENIQRRDFLEFQINEFKELDINAQEEERLIQQKEHLLNFEQNQQRLSAIQNLIDGDHQSLLTQFKQLCSELEYFPSFAQHREELEKGENILNDISYEVSNMLNEEIDHQQLELVLDKLDRIQKIKRKYNLPLNDIEKIIDNYQQDLTSLDGIDLEIEQLNHQLEEQENRVKEYAQQLHKKRIEAAKIIERELNKSIHRLNMPQAILKIKIEMAKEFTLQGSSFIQILAETNPGEGVHPLKQIASGGELSRILLAFRQVLSTKDSISIFLFDEIDTGIGGETAVKIGQTLRDVAQHSQVIAITHLPQIAHFADQLIDVNKQTIKQENELRTISCASIITDKQERENYIRKMVPII